MKKIRVVWLCAISFVLLSYTYIVFFFLNRRYIPIDHRGVQTEVEYLLQQLNKHDPHAYIIVVLHVVNAVIIISAIIYTINKVRKMIKNKQTDKTSLDKK